MRIIDTIEIKNVVKDLLIQANYILPDDIKEQIISSQNNETDKLSIGILQKIQENAKVAIEEKIPICQDTGIAVIFIEIGQEVLLSGNYYEEMINLGVKEAYLEGYLRKSIVLDPIFNRQNTNDNTPAIIHTRIVKGDKIEIIAAPKGFGSENMSAIKMFNPSASKDDLEEFIVNTVRIGGGNPCPPIVVGIGIGGNFEYSAYLAKKALATEHDINKDKNYLNMENEILKKINNLKIGPAGFGGDTTALSVNILSSPTHIAGLPCAVNIGCHVTRHAKKII